MSFTHTITQSWSNGGASVTQAVSKTGELEINLEQNIAASQTDYAIVLPVDISQITALFIVCDTAITLETNDGSSPDDTIVLAAGVPLVYIKSAYTIDASANENPFDADITALYATNGAVGAAGSTLKIRILLDPTV